MSTAHLQVLLEPVPGLMGSMAEVRITSPSRWSVRGELLRILHTCPDDSGGSMNSGSSRSSVTGTQPRSDASADSCSPPAALLARRQRQESAAVPAAEDAAIPPQAAPGCSTCGAAVPCSSESAAESAVAPSISSSSTTSRLSCGAGSSDAGSFSGLARQSADGSADSTCTAEAEAAPPRVLGSEAVSAARTLSVAAQAAAPAEQCDGAVVQRTELADVLLCIGVVLGLCGMLVSGVLTLLPTPSVG